MRFWGILRVSGLCLLAIGFHGQPVSCGIFKGAEKSKKDSTVNTGDDAEGDLAAQVKMLQAKLQALEAGLDTASEEPSTDNITDSNVESPLVEEAEDSTVESQDAVPEDRKEPHGFSDFSNDSDSEYEEKEPTKEAEKSNEEHEQHDVAMKTETDVAIGPSTINLSDGSKNPDASMATPSSNGAAEDMEAEQQERLKEISEDLEDSTVESSSQSCLVFENATWDDSQLASTIAFIKEFCEEVKGYKFSGNIPAGNIRKLSEACSWVSFYLKSFRWRRVRGWDENPYKDALKPEKFKDYAEWLVKNLPVIRTSMINMFNESKKLTEKQRETATSSGPYKYGFVCNDNWWRAVGSQFFIYQFVMAPSFLQSLKDIKSSLDDILGNSITSKVLSLFSRGKKSDIDSQQESAVNEDTFNVVSQPSSPLPQSDLVFQRPSWDDSMLASTFLFINEFCSLVNAENFGGKLSDKKFKDLSEKCEYVSSYMSSFIHRFKPTYGPGSVTERKEIPKKFYKKVLKPEQFEVYAKWIVKNIPEIRVSLKQMYYESKELTATELKTETSKGPLKYGFVLKDCNRWQRFIWFDIADIFGGMTFFLELLHSYLTRVLQNLEGSTV
ncbi:secreted antigen 1 [Babesia divergens]|uniref:Secreted antigen 1 n=1 Tax=Babesia divergens TaxID=32595 RepID=A0AAD9LJH7_BABDI|nr:secreted antigen 1 [Babesia divergens]